MTTVKKICSLSLHGYEKINIKMINKIYYIANARLPTEKAHGYQILQMCQAFQAHIDKLTLLCPNRVNLYPLRSENNLSRYYGLRKDIKVAKLWTLDLIHWVSIDHPFLSRFGFIASWLQTVTFGISLIAYFRKQPLNTQPPTVLYLRDINLASLLLKGLPRQYREKLLVEVHSLSSKPWRQKRQAKILAKVHKIVCVTGAMKNQLIGLGVSQDKLMVAHDAVDLESFDIEIDKIDARRYLGLPEEGLIAAFVGKFHTMGNEKGIPDIIKAAKFLINDFPNLHFYFVGGPLERVTHYEQIIASEGLPRARFVFLEKQPIQKVPYFLKASDVLLMPFPWSKHYAYYMSPLKLFEYMSAKRPIIASCLPSIMEVLRDKENALLGEPGNPHAIAQNIQTALRETEIAKRISEQAYAEVHEYTWKKRAENILKFISESTSHCSS